MSFFSYIVTTTTGGNTGEIGEIEITPPATVLSDSIDLQDVLTSLADYLLPFVAVFAVLMIVIGGIYRATAAGDEERIEKAKKMIKFAIIGLLVAVLSYAIVKIVINSFDLGSNI